LINQKADSMSNDKLQEIEVKLYTPDLNQIKDRLIKVGANLVSERVFERNVRYENPDKTFTARGIVLRLRQDNKVRLTYKSDPSVANGIIKRYEAEVEVSDYDTMDAILQKLAYVPYMVYEKYRTTYELDGAEIVLDELPYGNFTEIEGDLDHIEALISTLGLSDFARITSSYTRLFEHVKQHLNLDFSDLTFANFEGIAVPESAFKPITI